MTLEIDFKIENLKTHPPDIHSQDQLSNHIISSSPGTEDTANLDELSSFEGSSKCLNYLKAQPRGSPALVCACLLLLDTFQSLHIV